MSGSADMGQRAEALAIIFLTDRSDLRVVREGPDLGYDLRVTHLGLGTDSVFGVQVKSVARSTSTTVLNSRLQLQLGGWAKFSPPTRLAFPIVLLVYAVDSH